MKQKRNSHAGASKKSDRARGSRPVAPAPKPKHQGRHESARPQRASGPVAKPFSEERPKGRLVIGTHAIFEVIAQSPKACHELWLQEGWEANQDLKKIHTDLFPFHPTVRIKPEGTLAKTGSHQGAALFVNYTPEIDWAQLERTSESTVLLLDGIEDPHNLGAILRTSWLMNVSGALIPEERACGLTPVVHKVACGGVEHVPVEACGQFAGPVEELKKMGYWVFGLSHEGKKTIFDLKIPEKVVWCIGAEDKGLRSTTERLCDELVHIPQASAQASYNASVATAMALVETLRQRRTK